MVFVYSGFVLLISLGMIVAGRGYIRIAERMRGFATTRARILERKLSIVSQTTEGRSTTTPLPRTSSTASCTRRGSATG
jgi:hypothetical protein